MYNNYNNSPNLIISIVFSAKRNLKNHKDNVFITENLTPRRRKIMDELNYLRVKRRILEVLGINLIIYKP